MTQHSLPPDPVLVSLAHVANMSHRFEIGITLSTGGTVVTGKIIGGEQWHRDTAALLQPDSPLAPLWLDTAEVFAAYRARHDAEPADGEPTPLDDDDLPKYLHLKDASIVAGTTFMPRDGSLWRVRLSAIDAYTLGYIN